MRQIARDIEVLVKKQSRPNQVVRGNLDVGARLTIAQALTVWGTTLQQTKWKPTIEAAAGTLVSSYEVQDGDLVSFGVAKDLALAWVGLRMRFLTVSSFAGVSGFISIRGLSGLIVPTLSGFPGSIFNITGASGITWGAGRTMLVPYMDVSGNILILGMGSAVGALELQVSNLAVSSLYEFDISVFFLGVPSA